MQKTTRWELSEILGDPKTRKEVLAEIEKDEETYQHFMELDNWLQDELLAFCMGNKGLKITYDPFFKYIFNPISHPERLSEVLSLLLGEEVEIVEAIPNESLIVTKVGPLLITDIIVRLKTGDYANIEIQRIGYQFPGQRCAAYSSDVMMRQIRKMRRGNNKFKYAQLKKVYTIVFIEQSIAAYWQYPDKYIHHARQIFDTGLELDLLQEFIIIPLDVFRKIPHNEIDELKAWLYFIGSDEPRDICRIVEKYPKFRELYKELIELRYDTKGLLNMFDSFRELLRECDKEAYEEMFREMKEQKELFIKEQEAEIAKQDAAIAEKEKTIAENEKTIAENEKTIAENEKTIAENEKTIAENEKTIAENEKKIAELKRLLVERDSMIESLREKQTEK